jgi:hypothetical protein
MNVILMLVEVVFGEDHPENGMQQKHNKQGQYKDIDDNDLVERDRVTH